MNDEDLPWNQGVRGSQALPLINHDCPMLRVAAGPGTGKTFGLKRRVLRVIHPDGLGVSPDRVLVCTFNRVIADDLRREIEAELSAFGLESPMIRTVHGLAASLNGSMPRFLLPEEIEEMMYDIRHVNPGLNQIYQNKQAQIMRALREHEAGLVDHPALGTAVRQWLTDHGAALIGDLPRSIETRLRGGDFGDRRYDHIVVDEFQDLTETEVRLLLGLRSENSQFTALGDRKQSIYAFRGNQDRGLEALGDTADCVVTDHHMDECQRCPSTIVRLANDVMSFYNEPLIDAQGHEGQIHQVHSSSPEEEQTRIAAEVVRVFRERPREKHLILVTRRQWGYNLRSAIKECDPEIQVQTVFSEDVLETWPAREAFVFLSIIGDATDAAALRDWIAYQEPDANGKKWKATSRNAAAYASIRGQRGTLTVATVREIVAGGEQALSGAGRHHVFLRCNRLVSLLADVPEGADSESVITHVFDVDRWVTANSASPELARDDVERLKAESLRLLEEDPTMSIKSLVARLRTKISTREPLGVEDESGVKIVTLWGAKGLTADFVYLTGMCDEAIPGRLDADSSGLTQGEYELEQLRLLYVSLTRAKKALVISRPLKIKRGKVAALGLERRPAGSQFWQTLKQCRFFENVPAGHLPDSVSTSEWQGIRLSTDS